MLVFSFCPCHVSLNLNLVHEDSYYSKLCEATFKVTKMFLFVCLEKRKLGINPMGAILWQAEYDFLKN